MISHSERLRHYAICRKLGHEPLTLKPDSDGMTRCQNCLVRYRIITEEDPTTVPLKTPGYLEEYNEPHSCPPPCQPYRCAYSEIGICKYKP